MLQLICGKWITQSIGVVVELGIADRLKAGARSAEDLASETGSNADALYRLLRGLTAVGVFREEAERRFGLNDLGETLCSEGMFSLAAMARLCAHSATWKPWGELGHSVKTGEPAFAHVHGVQAFEYLKQHPEDAPMFNDAMTSMSNLETFPIVGAYDFSAAKTVVDVGGGHGALLAAILESNPHLSGILFEMPHAVEGAKKLLQERGLGTRVEAIAGDFFEKVPEGGDIYLLKHVIHDWDDERALSIMRNCATVMKPGARLLLAEMIVSGPNEPDVCKLLDLEMLVITDGGRQRTEAELASLYRAVGLQFQRVVPTLAPVSLVEGVR
jgi:C-methyltransferase